MNKLPLILIGGGGHCKSCIDVIKLENKYSIRGIIDAKEPAGKVISGYEVLGNDDLFPELIRKGDFFLITIGQIKTTTIRAGIYNRLKEAHAHMATVISPRAHVSPDAIIGGGTIVLHGAIVNAGTVVGSNCIVNTLSMIEHDARVGDHVHISTGALVNGGCSVGSNSFIGSGSVISNNISITDYVVIGAGSVVIKDILSSGVYVGNPVKKIKDE